MALKKFKPTTPGRRGMTGIDYSTVLTASSPNKALSTNLKKHAGRNNTGRLTIRHQGSGHAKRYRLVDFHLTDKKSIPARIETVEYDPYRTAFIALVCYADGERRYILAHSEVKVGDTIITDDKAPLKSGNRMLIGNIPVGLKVHNVELIVGAWASSVRSAGASAQIFSQEGEYTQVKLPSGEIRLVHKNCYVDHPHGGWEGRSPIGMKAPKTPWGKVALGKKTRNKKKTTGKWILKTRKGKLMM